MSSSLILHRGAHAATLAEVTNVATPPPTDTWFPIPHVLVLETVLEQVETAGFRAARTHLALKGDGSQFFATLDLESTIAEGVALAVGVRNSVDKSLPMGFAAGHRATVCDNLAFHSDLMVVRKHSRFGMERFRESIALAAGRIGAFQQAERARVESMRTLELNPSEAESAILRAWEGRVISHLQLPAVLAAWREPPHPEFEPRTRWSLFNAFTEVLKPFALSNPQAFAARTFQLNRLLCPPAEGPADLSAVLAQARADVRDLDAVELSEVVS